MRSFQDPLHICMQCKFFSGFSVCMTVYRGLHCVKSAVFGLSLAAFSRIWTVYGEILFISPYSIRMRENTDQNNAEYRHFLRSVNIKGLEVYL